MSIFALETVLFPLLSHRTPLPITGVELQKELVEMATRSIHFNRLNQQIRVICEDIRGIWKRLGNESSSLVTCNPPYFKSDSSYPSQNSYLNLARHDVTCTLEDVARSSSRLLKQGGRLYIVHRPNFLLELFEKLRIYKIEPKEIQFVHPTVDTNANTVLVMATKGGKPSIKILPSFIVYNSSKTYTKEMEILLNVRQ